jgi:hypothetical protein
VRVGYKKENRGLEKKKGKVKNGIELEELKWNLND